jgi:4-amino-4-deoxy-L-arabinose transferase-like glycosyltransferase
MNEGKSRRDILVIIALSLLALGARIYRLNQGFWYDELYSLLNYIHAPLFEMLTSMPRPNNHILANILARLSMGIFGEAEWSARLPSVILGSLSVPLLYLSARKILTLGPALLASLLFCFSKWPVWFSQEMRGYAGMIFCVLASQMLFLEMTEKFQPGRAMLYFLASLAGIYFHLYSAFVIASQAIVFILFRLWRKQGVGWKPFLVIAGVSAASIILYAPVLGSISALLSHDKSAIYGSQLSVEFFYQWMMQWGAGSDHPFLSLIFALLFSAGFINIFLKTRVTSLAWILPVVLVLLSSWLMKLYIYHRFLCFFIPFYFIFVATGIETLSRWLRFKRLVFYLAAVLVLAALIPSLNQYYRLGMQGFKKAARFVQHTKRILPVYSIGLSADEFRYYLSRAIPVPVGESLDTSRTEFSFVLGSHPWSWGKYNTHYLKDFCYPTNVWPSAGYDENEVTLFICEAPSSKRPMPGP